MKRMPALFIGHGSPMLALDHNEMTKTLTELGKRIITDYGRPKAIAVVSAHWYSRGSYVNAAQKPEQIYDMYGFPKPFMKSAIQLWATRRQPAASMILQGPS